MDENIKLVKRPLHKIDLVHLTPSLHQLRSEKMHGRAHKQRIFRSSNTSTLNVMHFDENAVAYQCEKEDKMA